MLTDLDRKLQMSLPYRHPPEPDPENLHMSDVEKEELMRTPRPDALSDIICALQFARTQAIDMGVRAKQCETNLDVALGLLQQMAAKR